MLFSIKKSLSILQKCFVVGCGLEYNGQARQPEGSKAEIFCFVHSLIFQFVISDVMSCESSF